MPKSKKQKTSHNSSRQPYSTRKNHQNSNGDNALMSHEEIWDDSALLRSWDDAVKEYEFYHSIHARGEDVDEVLRRAEEAEEKERLERMSSTDQQADVTITSQNHDRNSSSSEDGEVSENDNQDASHRESTTQQATFPTDEAWHQSIKETSEYAAAYKVLNEKTPYPNRNNTREAEFEGTCKWLDLMMGKATTNADIEARCIAVCQWLDENYEKSGPENDNEETSRDEEVPDITINNSLGLPANTTTTAMANGAANVTTDSAVNASTSTAEQTLENIKMAYYWAGYYSGLYDAQRQAQSQEQKQ